MCDGVTIESGVLGTQKHVSGGNRPAQIACQNGAYDRCEFASIQWVRLYHHDRATVARGGPDGVSQIGPPHFALGDHHSTRCDVC